MTPNPSIERAATDKPVSTAHLKRYAAGRSGVRLAILE